MKIKIIILILAGFMAFAFVLNAPFKTLDDQAAIINNPLIKDFSNVGAIFTKSYFGLHIYWRPLVFLSYMVERHLFGLNPLPYYLINIVINIGAGIIVFLLMRLFFDREDLAFFTALLFTIHPIHATAVTNISGRPILLGALFYLLAFYCYCRYKKKGQGVFYVSALFLFLLSLLSKESAVMLPILLLFYEYVFCFRGPPKWWRTIKPTLPFWGILGLYFTIRQSLGIARLFQARSINGILLQFLTFARGVFTYLRLLVLPYGFHFDRSMRVFTNFSDPAILMTITVFFVGSIIFIWKRKTVPKLALFFIGWFFIELVPVSQVFVGILIQPGYIALSEHFVYIASIGIFALIVMGMDRLYRLNRENNWVSGQVFKSVVLGLLVFLLSVSVVQSIYSSSERAMLAQTLKYNPNNVRMRESYAWSLVKLGLLKEAEQEYHRLLKLDPSHVPGRISLGKVLCDQGRYAEGLSEYEKIKNAGLFEGLLYDNITAVLKLLIDQNTASGNFRKAEEYRRKLDTRLASQK